MTARLRAKHWSDLTPRENEILLLIAQGLSNLEIAAELGIARSTVTHHSKNLLVKLDASNRTEAVAHAYVRGLLALPARSCSEIWRRGYVKTDQRGRITDVMVAG